MFMLRINWLIPIKLTFESLGTPILANVILWKKLVSHTFANRNINSIFNGMKIFKIRVIGKNMTKDMDAETNA